MVSLTPDIAEPDARLKKRERGLTLMARGPFEGQGGQYVKSILVRVTNSGSLTVTVPQDNPSKPQQHAQFSPLESLRRKGGRR